MTMIVQNGGGICFTDQWGLFAKVYFGTAGHTPVGASFIRILTSGHIQHAINNLI